MRYEYKMIQVPPHFVTQRKNIATAAAEYLQEVVNKYADEGWEFFRIDDFSTEEQKGCLNLLGIGETKYYTYKVITFRRERDND